MADTRKKLIELLKVPIHPHLDADPAEVVADYLIANGVTFAEYKWISVKDRLPETEDVFLCWSRDLSDMMFCYTSDFEKMEVTHWMSLPQPPKEDK